MLERLVETFCEVDDFCKALMPQWEAYPLGSGSASRRPVTRVPAKGILLPAWNEIRIRYNAPTRNTFRLHLGRLLTAHRSVQTRYQRLSL